MTVSGASRLLGVRRALAALAAAAVFAALAAPPPASAEPGASPRPFTGAGETGMAGMGTGQDVAARRSQRTAPTDGAGGFRFDHDRFTPLAAVPGAGPQLHYAIKRHVRQVSARIEGSLRGTDGITERRCDDRDGDGK